MESSEGELPAARAPEAVSLHSQDNGERSLPVNLTAECPSQGPGLLLELSIRSCYLDWIAARQVWATRFGMQIVHEARSIQLIDWFDSFPESSCNVRSGATEVVTRQVPFAGVIRWDVLDQGNHQFTTEGVATPPRRPGR